MGIRFVNPETLVRAAGYSHGATTVERGTRPLALAGQVGCDGEGRIDPAADLVQQFGKALDNLLAVLAAAGAAPTDVASLRIYTTRVPEYRERLGELGAAYRARFGKHFPAMALLGVAELFDAGALVEIEGVAYVH